MYLNDEKHLILYYRCLGINCVADVVRHGRLRWFGHLERKSVDDWVSSCRMLVVEGARGQSRNRKMCDQCVKERSQLVLQIPCTLIFEFGSFEWICC